MAEQRSPLAGRSILVTGAEGRIGTATCEHLSALGASVTGVPVDDPVRRVVSMTDEAYRTWHPPLSPTV